MISTASDNIDPVGDDDDEDDASWIIEMNSTDEDEGGRIIVPEEPGPSGSS
jgi:hypothetical protein